MPTDSADREPRIPGYPSPEHITQLLSLAKQGSRDAFRTLFPIVYNELRRMASGILSHESPGHTIQPTALVHEAYLKLLKQDSIGCADRSAFLGIAAQAMRRILVDHARTKKRKRRGGGQEHVLLEDAAAALEERAQDLVALDQALTRLKEIDERKARIVELRFFAGLKSREVSDAIGVPLRTCERDWTMARAWLHKELGN